MQLPLFLVLALISLVLPLTSRLVTQNQENRGVAANISPTTRPVATIKPIATPKICTAGVTGYVTCPDGSRAKQYRDVNCNLTNDCGGGGGGGGLPTRIPTRAGSTPGSTSPTRTGATPTNTSGKVCTAGVTGYITCPDGSRAKQYRDVNCNLTDDCSGRGGGGLPTQIPTRAGSTPGSTSPTRTGATPTNTSGKVCTAGVIGYISCPDGSRVKQYRDVNCNLTDDCVRTPSYPSATRTPPGYPTLKPSVSLVPTPLPYQINLFSPCSGGYGAGSVAIGPDSETYRCRADGLWEKCSWCPLNIVPAYVQNSPQLIDSYIKDRLPNQNVVNNYLNLNNSELAEIYCGSNASCKQNFDPLQYLMQIKGISTSQVAELTALRNIIQATPIPTPKPLPTSTPRPLPTATAIITLIPTISSTIYPTISPRLTISPSPRLTISPSPRLTISPSPRLTISPSPRLTTTIRPSPTTSIRLSPTGVPSYLTVAPTNRVGKCTAGAIGTCRCDTSAISFCTIYRDVDCNTWREGCQDGPVPTPYNIGSATWTYYSQRDPRWSAKPIVGGIFINSGCGPTSTAMLICTYLPSSCVDPYTLQQAYFPKMAAGDVPNFGTTLSENAVVLRDLGFNPQPISSDIDVIRDYTSHGIPVLVIIESSAGGHITIITSVTANGELIAQDPYFGSNINLNQSSDVKFGGIRPGYSYAIYPPK